MINERAPGEFYRFRTFDYITDTKVPYKVPTLSLGQFYPIAMKLVMRGLTKKPGGSKRGYNIPTIIGDIYFRHFLPYDHEDEMDFCLKPYDRWDALYYRAFYMLNDVCKITRANISTPISENAPDAYAVYTLVKAFSGKLRSSLYNLAHLATIDLLARIMFDKVGGHVPGSTMMERAEYFLLLASLEKALTAEDSFSSKNAWETAMDYTSDISSMSLKQNTITKGVLYEIEHEIESAAKLNESLVSDLFGEDTDVIIKTPFTSLAFILARRALSIPDVPYECYQRAINDNEYVQELIDVTNKGLIDEDGIMTQDLMFLYTFKLINAIVDAVESSERHQKTIHQEEPESHNFTDIEDDQYWIPYIRTDDEDDGEIDSSVKHNFARSDGTEFEGGLDE